MSEVLRKTFGAIESSTGGDVVSGSLRVGGNLFDVQIDAPDTLVAIEVSGDKLTWYTATDIAGTALIGVGSSYAAGIREGAEWVRMRVATDAGGPQLYSALVMVHKQASA